eukprot:gene12832-16342_t
MNSIANSLRREARRLAADPWDLAMVTWVPLLGVALLWWIFSAGLPRHLAVGVVDDDHSSLSRQLVRMLDATPGVQITQHFTNASEAERALRAVDVYAVVSIPRDFARTVKEGRAAQVTLLHNAHCRLRFWRLAANMDHLVRNADGDELLFVHAGRGELFCDYGHLSIEAGDYVLLPRGTMW